MGRPRTKGERLPTLADVLATRPRAGAASPCPAGMAKATASSRSAPKPPSGAIAGLPVVPVRWVLLRDPLRALRPAGSPLHRPTRRSRCRSSAGSSSAGSSKSPSAKCATTLGVETQRQWSDLAIAAHHALPARPVLDSRSAGGSPRLPRPAPDLDSAWYRKPRPTFADTLAAVRRQIWIEQGLVTSRARSDSRNCPRLPRGFAHALCMRLIGQIQT